MKEEEVDLGREIRAAQGETQGEATLLETVDNPRLNVSEVPVLSGKHDGIGEVGRNDEAQTLLQSRSFLDGPEDEFLSIKKVWNPSWTFYRFYCRFVLLYLVLPLLVASVVLYYAADNPLVVSGASSQMGRENEVSISYWMLFVTRNLILVSMAKGLEVLVMDIIHLPSNSLLCRVLFEGRPGVSMFVASSRGWPFVVTVWASLGLGLLYGDHPFARHWLYYQGVLGIFNECNPAGNVTSRKPFLTVLSLGVSLGVLVTIKRFIVTLILGKNTYANFAERLSELSIKIHWISEVAKYSHKLLGSRHRRQKHRSTDQPVGGKLREDDLILLRRMVNIDAHHVATKVEVDQQETATHEDFAMIVQVQEGQFSSKDKARIRQLLGQWEDPIKDEKKTGMTALGEIMRFHALLNRVDTTWPFSGSFGLCDSRDACVVSSQALFLRLLRCTCPGRHELCFEVLARLARNQKDGSLDEEKVRQLIRIFTPNAGGTLSLVDFASGIDKVYKELRLLIAAIDNSSKLDRAFESVLDVGFYALFGILVLYILGIDPLAIFLSFSALLLSFRFMIRRVSEHYFEGLLFILVQRPYTIGDRVNIADPTVDSVATGTQTWFVEDITLYMTTFVLGSSGERSTISNGAIAMSRVINANRSPKASVAFGLKFGLAASFEQIEEFKAALQKFVEDRPRQFISLAAFRAGKVEADHAYIEYRVVLKHRESWQNLGAILNSKAVAQQFCLELQKSMGIRYESPHRPVTVTGDVARMWQTLAQTQSPTVMSPRNESRNLNDIDSIFDMFQSE